MIEEHRLPGKCGVLARSGCATVGLFCSSLEVLMFRSLSRAVAVVGVVALPGVVACFNTLFPFAPDQLFETGARANCAFVFRCCDASERGAAGLSVTNFRNEDECVEESLEQGGALALIGQRAKAVVDAGNGEYDAALAEECTKPVHDAAYACDATGFLLPSFSAECQAFASRGFVRGKIGDGDDCTDDIECADEGTCVREEQEDGGDIVLTIAGTCRAAAGAGESCEVDGQLRRCQAGLSCEFDGTDAFTCEEVVLKDEGEDCFDDGECKSGNCIELDSSRCSDSGNACAEDSDCDEENFEFCDFEFLEQCAGDADADADIEICDGK